MDVKLLLCVWAFLCLGGFAESQRPGTDFALVFMQNVHLNGGKNHLELLLTSFFPDTNVNIQLPRRYFSKMVTLTTGIPTRVELPKKLELLGSVRSNMTVHITSNKPISVVAINKRLCSTGVAVLSPISDWGSEYYIMTPVFTTEGLGQIAIVNGPKPNSISILLTSLVQFGNTTYFPGDQLNLTIGPWESIQLQTILSLTASHLVSQEDVAVFAGLGCFGGRGLCNHMFIQLPATTAWGSNFVIPPLPFPKLGKVTILSANDTLVRLVHTNGTTDVMVAPGMMEEFAIDPSTFLLIGSPERIMVLLNFEAASGILYNVPPMEKACVAYSVVSLPEFNNHILLVGHDDVQEGLELDRKPLLGLQWRRINMTNLVYANISLSHEKGYRFIYSGGHDFGLATVGLGKSSSYVSPGICLNKEFLLCQFECANSLCNITRNTSDCASLAPPTCMAWGEMHLLTFYESHMLTSRHFPQVLIKFQGDDQSLLPFSVEREPGFGLRVRITVFGQILEISAEQPGVIFINSEKRYTPINVHGGSLSVTRFGFVATVVKASFGLRVIIGDHGFLHLQIARRYYESLSGDCVAQSSKEMLMSTGSRVLPSPEFSGVHYFLEPLKPCDNTSATEEELANCQKMSESEIFQSCHLILNPMPFIDGCEIQVCNGGSSCSAIESYALICGINGVQLMGWRNISHCGLKCPPHSHYENCYTTCQASCSETQVSNCDTSLCYEACLCDEGYQLSAESCVPKDECGCYWHGSYYPKGEEFFGKNCKTRCHCSGLNMECGQIEGCDVGHTCVFMSGMWSCQPVPFTSCTLYGGSHYIALDGQAFNFKGHCDSKMAGVCVNSSALENFTVNIVQEVESFTSITAVKILVYGKSITFSPNYKGKVNVDGALVHTPYVVGTSLQIYRSNLGTEILQTDFGLVVSFDQMKILQIKVPNSYLGSICGLCASIIDPLSNLPLCQGYCQDGCTRYCANENYRVLVPGCGAIKDPHGAFSGCHHKIAPYPYFEACVSSMCYSLDLCPSVYAYAAACREAGADVALGIRYAQCGYSCPPNSTFKTTSTCTSACNPSCNDTLPLTCALECQDGCQCDPGYVLNGDSCVLPEDCGCYVDGQYWKRGDIFYDDQCQKRCFCLDSGIACESHHCTSDEQCTIVMGVRACYPLSTTCSVSGQTYHTFDGFSFLVNKTCPFVMAKVTNSDNVVNFDILLRRNASADGILTSVEEVIVNVYGYVIILNLSGKGLEINGNPTIFPDELDDRIFWNNNGSNIELKTDFGLHLTFNSSMVSLTIPLSYVERVFGLCGKANTLSGDQADLPIENHMSFWSTYVERTTCNDAIDEVSNGMQAFNATKYCEIIMEPEGPFQECHGYFDFEGFYDGCLSVMKVTQDYMQEICTIIQYYDDECQWAGVTVHPWRNETLCESERPPVEFSHFLASTPPDPVNHIECLPNLVPPNCPSLDKISCLFHGPRNFSRHEEDFLSSTECSLSLVEICLNDKSLGIFSASVHYEFLGNHTTESLHVKVYGLNIVFPQNWENSVWVDNRTTRIPVCLIPDKLQMRVEGHDLILDTIDGHTIKYEHNGSILIQLPFGYKNFLCGQCAQKDPSEIRVKLSSEMSKNSENSCLKVVKEPWARNEDHFTNPYYCSMLLGDESPFRECHSIVKVNLFYDACRIQVCGNIQSGGSGEYAACHALEEYTKLCQLHNVMVKPWRNETVCPYECPPRGTYELCTNTCTQCQHGKCSGPCLEGCNCTEGYLWNGVDCVNSTMCPKSIITVKPKYMNCGANSSQSNCRFCRLNHHQISTFGSVSSPLEGNGAYDIIRKCDPSAPQWLRIALSLQPSEPAKLHVFYRQNFITVNSTLEVWVNGQMEVLPVTLDPGLYISKATDVVVLGQPGTMDISFSSAGVLEIEVAESLWSELCGACAFGNPFTDSNPIFSLESWRADDLPW